MTYEVADWPFSLCKAEFFPSGALEGTLLHSPNRQLAP